MTTEQKVARRKLSLLELASELDNVSKACQVMGYSRQQFYEIRRNFQTYGAAGLVDRLPGAKGPHPNRVSEEIEQAVLSHSLAQPAHGPVRVSHELALQDIQVSSAGVRGVWSRHDLLTRDKRLLRLERAVSEQPFELSEEQIRLLERFSPEFRERHIETHYTGELVAVDTFFVGVLKGVGKVYLQTVIDCFSRYAWGSLYTYTSFVYGLTSNKVLLWVPRSLQDPARTSVVRCCSMELQGADYRRDPWNRWKTAVL